MTVANLKKNTHLPNFYKFAKKKKCTKSNTVLVDIINQNIWSKLGEMYSSKIHLIYYDPKNCV